MHARHYTIISVKMQENLLFYGLLHHIIEFQSYLNVNLLLLFLQS